MSPLPPISEVLVEIPAPDLSAVPTQTTEWTTPGTPGTPGGTRHAALDPEGAAFGGDSYFDFQVEKVAELIPGTSAPSYPESLRSAGVDGEALVQFVVDTLGRAELSSFRVLRATHDAFGASVRAALSRMRFLPAELDGRKVRMLVQQPFSFAMQRK
jgi:protein TonB